MKKILLIPGAILAATAIGAVGLSIFLMRHETALLPAAPEHGTAFVIELENFKPGSDTNEVQNLKKALQKRFSELGSAMSWEAISSNRFRVSTPLRTPVADGMDADHIVSSGLLEFRLVLEDKQDDTDFEVFRKKEIQGNGEPSVVSYRVDKKPAMAGAHIDSAMVSHDAEGRPEIFFTLTSEASAIFAKITRDNAGRQFAIVLDGTLLCAPRIAGEIGDGNGVLAGQFTDREANALAHALNTPLPAAIKLIHAENF